MKLLVIAMFALICTAYAEEKKEKEKEDKYTTKYDSIDIDEILKSDRLFKNYYLCLMEKGSCTAEGRELKKALPDALKTECSKCSEKQRDGTDKVLKFIIDNKPEEWKALQEKYDKEGVYLKKYRSEAEKKGIKL